MRQSFISKSQPNLFTPNFQKLYNDQITDIFIDLIYQTNDLPNQKHISSESTLTTNPVVQFQQISQTNEKDTEKKFFRRVSRRQKKDNDSFKKVSNETKRITEKFFKQTIQIKHTNTNKMFILYYWSKLQKMGLLTQQYVRFLMKQYQYLAVKIQQKEIDNRKAFGQQQIQDLRRYQMTLPLLICGEPFEIVAKALYNFDKMKQKKRFNKSFDKIKRYRQEEGLYIQ